MTEPVSEIEGRAASKFGPDIAIATIIAASAAAMSFAMWHYMDRPGSGGRFATSMIGLFVILWVSRTQHSWTSRVAIVAVILLPVQFLVQWAVQQGWVSLG